MVSRVNAAVQDYLRQHQDVSWFVVTDPDIALQDSSMTGDLLHVYATILEHFAQSVTAQIVFPVGAGIQMSDIPRRSWSYNKFFEGRKWKIKHTYSQVFVNGQTAPVQLCMTCPVDTTFGMFPRSKPFARLKGKSLRVHHPYMSRHLPFYFSATNLPADELSYVCNQNGASHIKYGLSRDVACRRFRSTNNSTPALDQ
jgi:hypothetical protein